MRQHNHKINFYSIRPPLVEAMERRVFLSTASFATPVGTQLTTTIFLTIATAVGDVNGDGVPDLLAARQDQSLQVFFGTKTGMLTIGPLLSGGGQVVALGDFNKDGKLDVATASGVMNGTGTGTFQPAASRLPLPADTVNLFTGDFNGDGNPDLAAAALVPAAAAGQPSTVSLSIFLGKGDGTFQPPATTTMGSSAGAGSSLATFATGDFNGDGKPDVLSAFGIALGNGDGTFRAPAALPLSPPSQAPPGATAPAASAVFAAGDFNADGKLDVATPPSGSSSGKLEILLGNGDGTFRDAGPISLGGNAAVTALAANDVNADGFVDLIAGTGPASTSNPGTAPTGTAGAVVVVPGNGDGTFSASTSVAVTGSPLKLSTVDFNGDGKADVLSIEGAANGARANGIAAATTADVLLNTSAAAQGAQAPTVTISASPRTVAVGSSVQLTAVVSGPAGAVAPTGSVSFFDGTTSLGSAPLRSGKATLPATGLGLGFRSITAGYAGDTNYAAATSTPIQVKVLVTTARVPLLVPSLGTINFPALFVTGDRGKANVHVTNAGNGAAAGAVGVNLFLSPDGALDASAVPLNVLGSNLRSVRLIAGHEKSLLIPFVAGNLPPGKYTLLAQLVPVSRFTADEVSATPAASMTSLEAAGNVFGNVGTHHLTFTASDAAGNSAVLSISGLGMGTVTEAGGMTNVAVTGTTASSVLHIRSRGGVFSFGSIMVDGALRTFDAGSASVTNGVSISGGASQVTLAAAGTPGGAGATIAVGNGGPLSLSLGDMEGVTLQSSALVRRLRAAAWIGGAINAPSIDSLIIDGPMSANVNTHGGGRVQSARIGTITGGAWAVSGALLSLRVSGDVSAAQIFAGADSGNDNALGTADDSFRRSIIGSIQIGGGDTSTLFAAGAAAPPGASISSGLVLLPRGAIRAVTVRGPVSADSRFLAASLPPAAILANTKVDPQTDPHFH